MVKFKRKTSYFDRVKNNRGNYDRTSYFIKIHFSLLGKVAKLNMKMDTGASRTVIGLGSLQAVTNVKNIIMQEPVCKGRLESATGGEISYREVVVDDFYLTPDVVFSKIKLAFSEDIGNFSSYRDISFRPYYCRY